MTTSPRNVSAADANRAFSRLLREVREEGASYVVTSHGRPVAQLTPVAAEVVGARLAARASLMSRLESQPAKTPAAWTRDELYERP
jgi:prevent-host-death family protein